MKQLKKYSAIFVSAILAGFCIALGGTVFLRIRDAFPAGNVVGALLFAIGLFTICTRGYSLFTGKVCYLFDNKPSYVPELVMIWIGNFLGCAVLACVERATGIAKSGIEVTAAALVDAKMESGLLSLFLLGLLCNICIYIAVNGFANNPHPLGKYLALFLGVSVFILCGFEHSVADMYYWTVSGCLAEAPLLSLGRILIISLGNAAGGVLFPLLEKLRARLTA